MLQNQQRNSISKKLCQLIEEYKGKNIKVLLGLEKESCMNWIIMLHFVQLLQKKYPNVDFFLGVSEKYEYFTLFDSNVIKVIKKSTKQNAFHIIFKLPVKEIFDAFKGKANVFDLFYVLNKNYIGLSRFMVSPPNFTIDGLIRDYSDKIFFNLNEDDTYYKTITNEIKKCSFKIVEFKDISDKDENEDEDEYTDRENDISLIPSFANLVEVTSNGFINYTSKFEIIGNNKINGKLVPSESIVLRYKNERQNNPPEDSNPVVHKLTGSGVVEYKFIVELMNNSVLVKLNLNEIKLTSGFSKTELKAKKLNQISNIKEIDVTTNKRAFIEEVRTCRYYIGKEDVNFLLASMILGPSNCILLDKESTFNVIEIFPYFDISNVVDLENYETGTIENKLEELQIRG